MKLICKVCKNKFESNVDFAQVCSHECRLKRDRIRAGRFAQIGIPTGTVGAISEMMVAADLMRKGYSVFRALSQSCFCDLVAFKNGKTLNVEVKTGYKHTVTGRINFPPTKNKAVHLYGIYERNENKVYFFDLKLKLAAKL